MAPPDHTQSGPPGRAEWVAATLLGIDHGLRRIGVALKPAGQDWSLPIRVIEIESEPQAIAAMRALVEEYHPAAIVIGLPQHGDPTQAKIVRRFARKARETTRGVRWFFADERFSSELAEGLALEGALSAAGAAKPSDDLAAKLILDQYMTGLKS